jgi:release factor glutamine methyltransferase
MSNDDLKQISTIRNTLSKTGYSDIQRISNEILQYSNTNHIPLQDILYQIKKGKPWEYIHGEVEFCGNTFKVSKDTLIPRIETEELVDITKKEINKFSPTLVIDIGTGSGCILLSLAKSFEKSDIKFLGTDISKKALKIAKENKNTFNIKNVSFKISNLLEKVRVINTNKEKYGIVANLPYIPTKQYKQLDPSVKDYEPRIALDGGANGLELYNQLFEQILKREKPLFLTMEFEPSTKKDLERMLKEYFPKSKCIFKKDFREKERFVVITF